MSVTAHARPIVVVKLGGSLLGAPRLDRAIGTILACDRAPVVVCGGGPFADCVRAAQRELGFSDAVAHRLALDAMRTVGEILVERHARLALVEAASQIAAVHRAGRVPLWTAAELRGGHPDIAESWDITSDSLSVWLAASLDAAALALVKSVEVPLGTGPEEWVSGGIVDAAFPRMAAHFRGRIACIGPAADACLADFLAPGRDRDAA